MAGDKKLKKITEGYVERAALHYLGRFSSTEDNLKRVLTRKVKRRLEEGQPLSSAHVSWIEHVVKKCVSYGYVDDAQYAKNRYESLLRKGKPLRTIKHDLHYKGVPSDVANALFESLEDEPDQNIDVSAAAAYVKRRRFAAFRRADKLSDEKIEKEKAAMMRAGFSYKIVQDIMQASEDELRDLLP